MKKAVIKIPASIGNMGSGFDCAGLSFKLYNTFIVERGEGGTVKFQNKANPAVEEKAGELFMDSFRAGLDYLQIPFCELNISVINDIPFRRGFGSSGTIILAGIIAAAKLHNRRISKQEILKLAVPIEKHIDNVAASLLGGFVIGNNVNGCPVTVRVEPPENLRIVAFIPDFELSTGKAREVLPGMVPVEDAVYNLSNFGMMCYAFISGDMGLLKTGIRDRLHQPYRGQLVPYLEELIGEGLFPGVYGACLSGAGPSVVFFTDKQSDKEVVKAVEKKVKQENLRGTVSVFQPGGAAAWKVSD